MDDSFVTSSGSIFGSRGPVGALTSGREQLYDQVRSVIVVAINETPEDEVLSADPATWAAGLADAKRITPPAVYVEAAELKQEGRVKVDCTNKPGISWTMSEFGHVIRPGYRFTVVIPASGGVELLKSRLPQGGLGLAADVEADRVTCTWDWPEDKGADELNEGIERFKQAVASGAEAIAADVDAFNASLSDYALTAIDKRRKEILDERAFLGKLSMPVVRDQAAPAVFGPPPIKRRETPARDIKTSPPDEAIEPDLDEFYEHILEVIRAVGRGLERSPGSFKDADEEALRDHMLVTLNTHYTGATYAEAFNRNGKTDILIRVYDRNAFIGECKWWHGPKALHEAFEQLFGYTTWRDSRVALIFYVKTKEITPVIEKAVAEVESRPEFIRWEADPNDGELRCRVRWPDDPNREATVTLLFFHLS